MPKVWNIGNTTVRNPKRIEKALRVFLDDGFSGNAKGSEIEARLHSKLKEKGVLEFDGESSDWNGRKWRAAFYQLGFISYEKYSIENSRLSVSELFERIESPSVKRPYQLTEAGLKLISATRVPEIEDIYLRQFCCYELPNGLESSFPEGRMKPFILFVQVLYILKNKGLPGLNKFETGLFLQKFRNHTNTLASEIIEEIVEYRRQIDASKTPKEIKAVRAKYTQELERIAEINPNSIVKDYSDTTFRYFTLSGLFTRIEDTIVLRNNRIEFVKCLIEEEPKTFFNENSVAYFKFFYTNSYPLPFDTNEFALMEILKLKEGIRDKSNPILNVISRLSPDSSAGDIRTVRYELIEYNNWQREEDFANEQRDEKAIKNILIYLKTLNNELVVDAIEIDDRPAYLEWTIWRSFLAINEIVGEVHKSRRFQLDEDFLPRNTAPGGGSDLIFEFESYVLVVEVTLTTSHRQMAVESEPVRRHTVQYKEEFPNKDIYCLFIAPEVDNNVVETFRIGVWYRQDEEEFVNIVPMGLGDFIAAFETLLSKRFRNSDFKTLLDKCLALRNVRAPFWKKNISKEIIQWRNRFIKTG